ncbi:hypothetical protein DPV78_005095 [Talaromyces pinophilus]|nr:hypothetical protein DPV78_005095 [Talaromyces pinophilus]
MATSSPVTIQPTKVNQQTFLGVIWGGAAIAIICVFLRTFSRIKIFKRLWVDDGFVIFALILVIANAILWQLHAQQMFDLMAVSAGIQAPNADFVSRSEAYSKTSVAVIAFFYSTLWSIKMAFLLFFRRLGENVTRQKYIWWPVCIFTVATYFACIGTIQYNCLVVPLQVIMEKCTQDSAVNFQRTTLKLNCAWDVISDFLIMAIPIKMLWGIQMRTKKKILLGVIFSLAIITVTFAIVRTTVVSGLTRMPDTSWLYMWSAIETTVALVVVSLASIRNLFTRSETVAQTPKYGAQESGSMGDRSGHRFYGGNFSRRAYIRSGSTRDLGSQHSVETDEQPFAMERVHVKHHFHVSHETV